LHQYVEQDERGTAVRENADDFAGNLQLLGLLIRRQLVELVRPRRMRDLVLADLLETHLLIDGLHENQREDRNRQPGSPPARSSTQIAKCPGWRDKNIHQPGAFRHRRWRWSRPRGNRRERSHSHNEPPPKTAENSIPRVSPKQAAHKIKFL